MRGRSDTRLVNLQILDSSPTAHGLLDRSSVFLAHMPAGYLLTKRIERTWPSPGSMCVGLLASVLPDLDLVRFYLVDHRSRAATGMNVPRTRHLAVALLVAAGGAARAQAPAEEDAQHRPLRLVVQMDVSRQVNGFPTVTYADGRSSGSLGALVFGLGVGGAYALTPDGVFELQALAGFRATDDGATDGSLSYYELPVLELFRLGG